MKKLLTPLTILLVLVPSLALAWSGKVVHVADGDTLTVLRENHAQVRIRLYGIDAPGAAQAFGATSKDSLWNLAGLQIVEVEEKDRDRYNRTVAVVRLSDGRNLNAEQVRAGLAWVYGKYCKEPRFCGELRELEGEAKAKKAGLWADANPTPPSEWRHGGSAEGKRESQAQGQVVRGDPSTRIYHRPSCLYASSATANFASREAAEEAGYRACKRCKP